MRAVSATIVLFCSGLAIGDVFNMPAGLTSLEMVSVGNPGNAPDTRYADPPDTPSGYGSVAYTYNMGKFEVTAGQYCEFLNAVAKTDTYGLYNTSMWDDHISPGCKIQQIGSSSNYTYSVAPELANRPVNLVSWGDAVRFCNWLANGQPTGPQSLATTEDGSYYVNGATSEQALMVVTRRDNARHVIPTEDEWYKAAHYDLGKPGGAGYWDYPTRMDTINAGMANYNSSVGHTTDVGAYGDYPSPYGTFDQGGNVCEWNETSLHGPNRGWRGGSFMDQYNIHASWRGGTSPPNEYGYVGFRIAEVPEPVSLLFLALGGLAMMLTKTRRSMLR
jgi:formylglycine-generating enzyme